MRQLMRLLWCTARPALYCVSDRTPPPVCPSCSGRTPIPPPLRSKFLVIERQREDEAAMGEQALETVLAPVPVPPVSYGGKVVLCHL